jgi:molybdopterin converting factor subunit 1
MSSMRVRVLFFGRLKDIVGRAQEDAEVNDVSSLDDLFARYTERYPELAGFRSSVVGSVNQVFADWQAPLSAGDEVGFLPPVSGGSPAPRARQQDGMPVTQLGWFVTSYR